MSSKLKPLCICLFATLAMSAFNPMSAAAGTGGHFYTSFVTQFNHPTIKVTEAGNHRLHLVSHGLGGEIGCTNADYTTTFTSGKLSSATVAPQYSGCSTTGGAGVTVTMNGCAYVFKVASGTTNSTEQTVDLQCPGTSAVEVHHNNCTITIRPQSNIGALTYTADFVEDWRSLTMDVNAEFVTQFEAGICIFTGTNHSATLEGSVTVEAFDTQGLRLDLDAT